MISKSFYIPIETKISLGISGWECSLPTATLANNCKTVENKEKHQLLIAQKNNILINHYT